MRLLDLEPTWLKLTSNTSYWADRADWVEDGDNLNSGVPLTLATADGILFLCPVCYDFHAKEFAHRTDLDCPPGHYGTHSILCWRPHVPAHISPGPGRWEFFGTDKSDLTLRAGSSSIFLNTDANYTCQKCGRTGASMDAVCRYCPCRAHFFITDGNIC